MEGRFYFMPAVPATEITDEWVSWTERHDSWTELADVTDSIKVLYDLAIAASELDDNDEQLRPRPDYQDAVTQLAAIAKLIDPTNVGQLEEMRDDIIHAAERAKFLHTQARPHRHRFQKTLHHPQCDYPGCSVVQGSLQAILDDRLRDQLDGLAPHVHAFSSVGRCMWSFCTEKQDN